MAASPDYLIDELKKAAQQKLISSFLGTGIVGRAVSARFQQKQQSEKSIVGKALAEQNDTQRKINTTIIKLEPLIASIAKTVNQIAKVWSKHVFAKQEELRKRREEASKDKSAAEEQENERKQAEQEALRKESLYGTKTEDTSGKGGVLGALISSNKSTKSFVKLAFARIAMFLAKGAVVAGSAYLATRIANAQDSIGEGDPQEADSSESTADDELSQTTEENNAPPPANEVPQPINKPEVSASTVAPTDYMAAQEAGIAGIPATQVGSAPVSLRNEGPLSFQRNINAAAGDNSQTMSVGTLPPLSIPSYPSPALSQPVSSSTSLPPLPEPTTQGAMKVATPNVSSVASQTNEVPYSAEKQIDAAAGEGPQTISAQQPASTNNIQPATPLSSDQSTSQPGQVYGETSSPSPMSSAQHLDVIRNTEFQGPRTREAYLKAAQTGNIPSAPGNVGGLSGLTPQNNESGSMLSSLTTMINNLIRQASENVPQGVTQLTQSTEDSTLPGPSPSMPSPVANRGSLDVGTTFDAHY